MTEESGKDKVKSIIEKLRHVIGEHESKIFQELENHDNEIYGAIILRLYRQILSLESGIRYHLSTGELYLAKILHRALIEHSVTLQYIWCKEHLLLEEEMTAEYFFIIYRIAENIKRFGFQNKAKRIIDKNIEKDTIKAYAEYKDEEPKVARNVLDISSQFKLEKMVEFLVKSDDLKFILGDFNQVYLDALSDYNILSSNVHGGPSALFWDVENEEYNEERISTDLDVFTGMAMKILIWVYTRSSDDQSLEEELT